MLPSRLATLLWSNRTSFPRTINWIKSCETQEKMRLEAEHVKMELEALNLERENVARAQAAERAAEEKARREQEAQAAAAIALKYKNNLLC